jgi:hypothetical protein
MPRIVKYQKDNSISDTDVLLGSDAQDNSVTKKFTIGGIRAYIIPSGGQAGQVLKSDGSGGIYWDDL